MPSGVVIGNRMFDFLWGLGLTAICLTAAANWKGSGHYVAAGICAIYGGLILVETVREETLFWKHYRIRGWFEA